MKKTDNLAALLGALIFVTPALGAREAAPAGSSSGASQSAGSKMKADTTSLYMETVRCSRLNIPAQDAAAVPKGERMVAGPGAAPALVQGSSLLAPSADPSRIFDPDPASYWHIDVSDRFRSHAEWVVFDIGRRRQAMVNYVRARPRLDSITQFFTAACLEGSNDGKEWRAIANLQLQESQKAAKWFGWRIPPMGSYRYFRLLISNMLGGNNDFYSIGKLELYQQ